MICTNFFLLVRSGFDMFRQLSSETKKNDLNYEFRDAFPYLTDSSILHFWSTSSAFHFFAFVQNSKCCFTLYFRLCFLVHFLSLRLLSQNGFISDATVSFFRYFRIQFENFPPYSSRPNSLVVPQSAGSSSTSSRNIDLAGV